MFRQPIVWILRPFVRPIIARIRFWVRLSVDESLHSNVTASFDSLHQSLAENARLQADGLDKVNAVWAATSHAVIKQQEALGLLELIRAANVDARAGLEATATTVSLLAKLFDRLQLGIDGLRIDHKRELSSQSTSIDDLTEQLARISAIQSEHIQIAGLTLARTDISLQRVAIPLGSDLLMRTPEAFLLVPSEDNALVSSMWESGGRLEPGTLKVLTALLSPGDHVIDVGANIGLITIPAAKCVGANGSVLAIEPSSRVADLLRRSVALNGLSNVVTLQQCAAGDEAGKATLNLGLPVGHSSLLPLPGSHDTEEVEVRRLDDLVPPKAPIQMVKIDAEGFEPQIWRGMQRIIADNPNIIIMVELGPEHLLRADISIEDWLGGFVASGLTAYEIDEAEGFLKTLRKPQELQQLVSVNLLLTRRDVSTFTAINFKNQN